MWVTTRSTFKEGDTGWTRYVSFIGLPHLKEVRTLDAMLNEYVQDCGSRELHSFGEVSAALRSMPRPSSDREYHLLFLDAETEALPPDASGCRFLGSDLSDSTHTSSLLNCGPWTGKLAQFTSRRNEYGLLTMPDAVLAKSLLPGEWPGDPHAEVTVWALYEIAPLS
jgi:hypothetical protein